MTWERGHEPVLHFASEAARVDAEGAPDGEAATSMRWAFETDEADLVWVVPDERYPGFAAALADALGPVSPAGEVPQLSTFWIDRAITCLDASEEDEPIELAAGNATALVLVGSVVRAVALYDTFPAEELVVDEVMAGLVVWRRAILQRISTHGAAIPTNEVGGVVGMRSPPM